MNRVRELLERPEWMQRAACRGCDPDLFFPVKQGDCTIVIRAKQICRGCSVRAECLDEALRNGEQHGAFGGLSVKERRGLTQRPTLTIDHGTLAGWGAHRYRGEVPCRLCVEAHAAYVSEVKVMRKGAQV